MCDIWKTTETREMPLTFVEEQLADFAELGVEWVVLSGGEPLMHSDLFRISALLRSRGMRVTVLTSGLLVHKYACHIARHVDDLIVSLDGPPHVHDQIRGVSGAYELIRRGVSEVLQVRPEYCVAGRCTVQKANHDRLQQTVEAARYLGLNSISFLAADVTSTAFNRVPVWDGARQRAVALNAEQVASLEREVEALIAAQDPFILDRPDHLRRIVARFRAYLGQAVQSSPRCNAPWVSAVIEVDGRLRPCFFHRPVGQVNRHVAEVINAPDAVGFRRSLDIATDDTCRRCVCSLYRDG
jgi:MoaA/NifB/PqqE/SkfB family radical SAM enzyme